MALKLWTIHFELSLIYLLLSSCMKSLKVISNSKGIILIIGMVMAIAVVGQPIIKEYIDCPITCEINNDHGDDDKQDSEEPVSEQISAFDAVTPAAQVQIVNTDFFIVDLLFHGNNENEVRSAPFIEKIARKFLKVLFNTIIAPNAP